MTSANDSSSQHRILVIDDEAAIRRFLHAALSSEEFYLHEAESGREGLAAATTFRPDVILLDLGLPDMDGIDVIQRLREWSNVPVIILSVRDQEDDKVAALDAGADDYLTKPFGVGELLARIRASLRRTLKHMDEPVFKSDELVVDLTMRHVSANGMEVQLTPTEYDLLRLLITHAGKVLTHSQILKQIWGTAYQEQSQVLRVTISNLRKKIERDPSRPRHITTEPGVGYRLRIKE
jgi:two-component system KDP operon response regulator KdpE